MSQPETSTIDLDRPQNTIEKLQNAIPNLNDGQDGVYHDYYWAVKEEAGQNIDMTSEAVLKDWFLDRQSGANFLILEEPAKALGKESSEGSASASHASANEAFRISIAKLVQGLKASKYVVLHALFPQEKHEARKDELIFALIAHLEKRSGREIVEEVISDEDFKEEEVEDGHDLLRKIAEDYLKKKVPFDNQLIYDGDLVIVIHNISSYDEQEHAKAVFKTLWKLKNDIAASANKEVLGPPKTFRILFSGAGVKELIDSLSPPESEIAKRAVYTLKPSNMTEKSITQQLESLKI